MVGPMLLSRATLWSSVVSHACHYLLSGQYQYLSLDYPERSDVCMSTPQWIRPEAYCTGKRYSRSKLHDRYE